MRFFERVVLKFGRLLFIFTGYLPTIVSQEETIVRAIFSPHHLDTKKKQLRVEAFDPTPGTDEISTMRVCFLGPRKCKQKALEFEDPAHKKKHCGFALLSVKKIALIGIKVVDSRKTNFQGHADIKTGCPMPPRGEPRDPEQLTRCREISKSLRNIAHYCESLSS